MFIYVASIATMTLSNFRFSEWPTLHLMGAVTVFPCIYTYASLSVYLIEQLNVMNIEVASESESAPTSMLISTVIGTVAMACALLFTGLSTAIVGLENMLNADFRLCWSTQNDGYWVHVLAAFAEWVSITVYTVNFLCLAKRMKCCKHWNEILAN